MNIDSILELMAQISAVAAAIPPASPYAGLALALIGIVQGLRKTAQQSAEWTPEAEAAFQQMLLATNSLGHWQPDPA